VAALTGESRRALASCLGEDRREPIPLAGAAGRDDQRVFMNHFQSIARGHFMLRRLERTYGEEAIRSHIGCWTRSRIKARPAAQHIKKSNNRR